MKKNVKLEPGTMYRALISMTLHQTKRPNSKRVGVVPTHGVVCFLGYSPGNEKIVHLLHNEIVGWVLFRKRPLRPSSGWFTKLRKDK